jgi:hypothetical protein
MFPQMCPQCFALSVLSLFVDLHLVGRSHSESESVRPALLTAPIAAVAPSRAWAHERSENSTLGHARFFWIEPSGKIQPSDVFAQKGIDGFLQFERAIEQAFPCSVVHPFGSPAFDALSQLVELV